MTASSTNTNDLSRRLMRGISILILLSVTTWMGGCATARNPDPFEPMNRKIFAFNDKVDNAVLKPVATTYQKVVPVELRTMTSNFFGNFKDAWSAVNLVLQGRFGDAAQQSFRVLTNSTVGMFGLADVATPLGMERHNEDFGQTLGKWGVGPGAYLVLPLLGPSTARDVINVPVEMQFSPTTLTDDSASKVGLTALGVVDVRTSLLSATSLVDDVALDKYSFIRDAYLQRRRNLVYDGNPPDEPQDPEEPEDEPEDNPPEPPQDPDEPKSQSQTAPAPSSVVGAASGPMESASTTSDQPAAQAASHAASASEVAPSK